MTLTIQLPDDRTMVLAAKARAHGLSAEEYAQQVLEHDLVPEWLQKSWVSSKETNLDQLSMAEIDAEIDVARKVRGQSRLQPGS
jgi:plasmid stability protein